MLTVFAPAKVNLVLEILGETADLHQVISIIQTINLCTIDSTIILQNKSKFNYNPTVRFV